MPTYQVTCSACGKEKWPTLPERPEKYVCALCRALLPAQRANRKEAASRAVQTKKARQKPPGDATGGV